MFNPMPIMRHRSVDRAHSHFFYLRANLRDSQKHEGAGQVRRGLLSCRSSISHPDLAPHQWPWSTPFLQCPSLCPRGLRTKMEADGSVIAIFLKLLSDQKTVIVKRIWYKTGSQWRGKFSHLRTRSENILSAQSSSRPTNNRWGSSGGRGYGGLCVSWIFTCRAMEVVSPPQSLG